MSPRGVIYLERKIPILSFSTGGGAIVIIFCLVLSPITRGLRKIFQGGQSPRLHAETYLCRFSQIPVVLAMWNQVGGSERQSLFHLRIQILIQEINPSRSVHSYICFFQSQHVPLVYALAGVAAHAHYPNPTTIPLGYSSGRC